MPHSEKFWNRISKNYDNQSKKSRQNNLKLIESTKKHLSVKDSVLDFACGTGSITGKISVYVQYIHGIDTSLGMIDMAKKNARADSLENIDYSQITIFDDQIRPESFDVILAFNILHLIKNVDEVVKRIHELLKPGGLFISQTACLGKQKHLLGIIFIILSRLKLIPYVNLIKTIELNAIIQDRKFTIIESQILADSTSNYFVVAKKNKTNDHTA